mmetsp:Transcript_31657/g.46306  ORF Transcript_31657/g.46306 Transcript_31657/m.46306 type:complete len:105 (+) Transcript_31657:50-364(+)
MESMCNNIATGFLVHLESALDRYSYPARARLLERAEALAAAFEQAVYFHDDSCQAAKVAERRVGRGVASTGALLAVSTRSSDRLWSQEPARGAGCDGQHCPRKR